MTPIPVLVHGSDPVFLDALCELLSDSGFATHICTMIEEILPAMTAIPGSVAVLQAGTAGQQWIRGVPSAQAARIVVAGRDEFAGLADELHNRAGGANAADAGTELAVADAPRGAHILIVDDETVIRELLTRRLTKAGFQCNAAGDGIAAMAAIQRSVPDVVILDLEMPEMDGMEFLRIAQHAVQREFGVIVLTGAVGRHLKENATNFGALTVLQKPIDFPKLLRMIGIQLDYNRTRDHMRQRSI